MRLDLYLTKHNFVTSRNKAKELILSKRVKVDSKIVTKPSFDIENESIEVDLNDFFVSRAGDKLNSFLKEINLEIKQKVCLDIGSSTGGFVQILLKEEAKAVFAVDVGDNQLHPSLRDNERVSLFENSDIREFVSDEIFDIVTCDVSFISMKYILQSIDKLANDKIIILFKPQFEVGQSAKRDKSGVVKDENAIDKAKNIFLEEILKFNWTLVYRSLSKTKGKSGNVEEFFYFQKGVRL